MSAPSGWVAVTSPLVAVADGLTGAGGEVPVVAAGHDDLTDMRPLAAGDRDGGGRVEVTGGEAGVLDGVVECVDVLVAAGRDRHGPPGGGEGEPVARRCRSRWSSRRPATMRPWVLVGVEGVGVAGAELQRGGGFPGVGEAVDADQLMGAAGGAQLGEQAAPPDRLELAGVADQDEPPVQVLGEAGEVVQGAGADHAGLVDDDGGADRGAGSGGRGAGRCRVHSWSSLATVSAVHAGLAARTWAALAVGATPNTVRPCRRRSSTAARSMVVLPVPAGPTTTTSRSSPATAAAASAWRTSSPSRSTVADGAGSASWASMAQVRIRSSSARIVGRGEVRAGGFQPHRPTIRRPACGWRCRGRGSRTARAPRR